MQEVYILQDQNDLYFTKQGIWHNGSEANTLYRTRYKDEAINTRAEQSVKSPHLRIHIIKARCNERGIPQVEVLAPATQETSDPCEGAQQLEQVVNEPADCTPTTL